MITAIRYAKAEQLSEAEKEVLCSRLEGSEAIVQAAAERYVEMSMPTYDWTYTDLYHLKSQVQNDVKVINKYLNVARTFAA